MKRLNIILLLLITLTIFLEMVNINYSNKISTDSIYAANMNEQIKAFEEENTQLSTDILNYSSYSMIASRAAELGFVETKNYISLYTPLEIAVRK